MVFIILNFILLRNASALSASVSCWCLASRFDFFQFRQRVPTDTCPV